MLKWLLTVVIVLVVFAFLTQRFPALRLPGDFTVPVRGRMYYIPIASTLLFSLVVWLISKVI
jgi:hypothetical protein